MSFVYSCIGDNTPENREHLEKLGYKLAEGMSIDAKYLYAYIAFSGEYCYYSHNDGQAPLCVVNCIGNDPLFRAVTAMRDDSDKDQYFIADANIFYHLAFPDGEPFFGDIEKGDFFLMDKAMMHADMMGEERFIQDLSHKASLAELQEHFKSK